MAEPTLDELIAENSRLTKQVEQIKVELEDRSTTLYKALKYALPVLKQMHETAKKHSHDGGIPMELLCQVQKEALEFEALIEGYNRFKQEYERNHKVVQISQAKKHS
ncbi:MAG: hypothetical protein V1837_00150 [Candidatus Woesearchaeota archaeon]